MANGLKNLSTNRGSLARLFPAVEEFRKYDKHGSMITLQAFALIACRAPVSRGHLAHALNISRPSMTSVLQRLSGNDPKYRPRWTELPMHLVTAVPNPERSGSTLATLAPEGLLLAERIEAMLANENPEAT